MLARQMRGQRVFDDVRRRIRRRQRNGDDEIGRHETEQNQHEQFAVPLR